MKFFLVAMGLTFGFAQSAFATGGVFCKSEVNDRNVDLTIAGALSHSIPGSPSQVGGALAMKSKKFEMHNIANIASLSQFWSENGQLYIMVYNEPESGAEFLSTKLVIKTKYSPRSGKYSGAYVLSATRGETTDTLKGAISCEMD
jgi:hypothetical protein